MQGISAPRTESLSVYRWSVPEKNKQGGWVNAFINTLMRFLGLLWKFWENRRSPIKLCNTSWKYQDQKRRLLKYVAFLMITNKLSNSLHEILHAITSTRSHFHIFKPIVWVFTRIVWFRRKFGLWRLVNENIMWRQTS